MLVLHNIHQKKKLKSSIFEKNERRITLSFYKYFNVHNPNQLRNTVYEKFFQLNIFGRIYIAYEGINAQINILKKKLYLLKNTLYKINHSLKNVHLNYALNQKTSFWMLKVKVRKKIVADGLPNTFIYNNNTGTYLEIHDVNRMLKQSNTIFVDMRNDYEYLVGRFKHAIHIPGSTFRAQLQIIVNFLKQYQNKHIVMYCTGGIRCEKAAAWLKYHHFKYVYQIRGGILNYVNESRKNNFLIQFHGKNFVFDDRMTEKISEHILSKCKNCNDYCDTYLNCQKHTCHRLFIQCRICQIKYNGYCSKFCKSHSINQLK
ncbi:rhodanese-related sulfurtransferase [Buchnera aphidicola (Takecallis taiwana)]|uniref:oxygen-dependent tRNA uridine(34) hydroxylase TrhO n=1 Tax=Buchnera aphidicola TaxID=9 RepID=UPI0031B672B2